MSQSYVEILARKFSLELPHIFAARESTEKAVAALSDLANYESDDVSVVACGSIGRGEFVSGSDVDWTLLVDGPADPKHPKLVANVRETIKRADLEVPNPSGAFGGIADSHELVGNIAGARDTNENLTLRMLLLFESRAVTKPLVLERVLTHVMHRYILHDTTIPRREAPPELIPHFLLNDVFRYWRTMATDFAAKMYERERKGWAIRNIKLRFSRKLIAMAGVLTAFSFELFGPDEGRVNEIRQNVDGISGALLEHVNGFRGRPPLDVLAQALDRYASEDTARKMMKSYDAFLGLIGTDESRERLKNLLAEDALEDQVWNEAIEASHDFRNASNEFFFDTEKIGPLIRRFGVF